MEETTTKNTAATAATPVVDAAEKGAAFKPFRQQHHRRRPLNLLQCMDKDGNIDAFRYIEYSRQRRMEFLQRADFICKMKSTLRMQHQQQLLHRSSSLPGMTTLPREPIPPSTMANEMFKMDKRAGSVSPETTIAFGGAVSEKVKSTGAGRSGHDEKNTNANTNTNTNNHSRSFMSSIPTPVRFLSRSASMPFVASSFGKNTKINNIIDTNPGLSASVSTAATNTGSQNAEFKSVPQRRLRREEFEAAEALLFGMGRGSSEKSHRPDSSTIRKRRNASSSKDQAKNTASQDGSGVKDCIASSSESKRRKISDPPRGETPSRSEEMGSVLSVVSQEDDISGNNINNSTSRQEENATPVHGFNSIGSAK